MKCLLVVYNNFSHIHVFPIGLAYIAAVLEKEGHEVEIYNQDMHHYPEEHLTKYLDTYFYDVVGISVVGGYYQYNKLLAISEAINKSKNRKDFTYIIGGHGPAFEPEYFLNKTNADCCVIGEGEETIVELLEGLETGNYYQVKGIAYRYNGRVVVNERRELIEDIDSIPFPAYHLFPINYYRLLRYANVTSEDFVMPVLSGRGCTFKCSFCARMDEGFRPRSDESIIEEVKMLKKEYNINVIDFTDELLMSSVKRTYNLCEAFLKEDLNIKWHCNGRLNYATKEVLEIMKKAGCIFINYGVEALDDEVLRNMNKALTVEQIIRGVENTVEIGISPGLNIMWGNRGDTKETLQKAVDFLLKYDDGAQLRTIRPVTCYPGCQLYYDAIKMGLLKDIGDFYTKHTNSDLISVNFTDIPIDEMHQLLLEANTVLITNYYQKKLYSVIKDAKNLYLNKNSAFRGFRQF